jgi:Ca2+-transporting ATPase
MPNILNARLDGEYDKIIVGLTSAEAKRRLDVSGENVLKGHRKNGVLKMFAGQFHDVMVMILLVATVISVALGRYTDAVPIVLIVVINAFLGFFQEYRCEKTLEQLESMTAPTARVYRDGKLVKIPASQVVVGDIFSVRAGDRIPCDGYIISCKGLMCDESVLTGESAAVEKFSRTNEVEFTSANRGYMGYMGTVVTKGTALLEAVATGEMTQMGKISRMLDDIEDEQTPLQKKLGELGRTLAIICIGVCVIVFVAGVVRGEPILDMAMTGITVAIAAIPEGLPATVTIALSIAVRKMLKRNALVHRLHSVETLGCATVICTDKTGTITQNKMTVTEIVDSEGNSYKTDSTVKLPELILCGMFCNNAQPLKDSKNQFDCEGEPTETAIMSACMKMGGRLEGSKYKRVDEIPFDSGSRSMTVICKNLDGEVKAFVKGAADVIVNGCDFRLVGDKAERFGTAAKTAVSKVGDRLASEGLRVIAFEEIYEDRRIFLGLMAMEDPPRPEATQAVGQCAGAGIRTVMITGDHKLTAQAIAGRTGIMKSGSLCLTGEELDRMSDEQLSRIIENCSVFARVTPEHKLRIVRAFKENGHVCAMTGDGVNDAPAVKEADIGVAMGIQGTEVTKQAADVILLDDNFATLVNAVEDGRTVYRNIRKFVRYLISCNIGEVLTMFGGILMGLPMVLLPSQILLVNLVTDSLPAVALGLEPPEEGVMKNPPRREDDSFFSDGLLFRIIIRGILIGLCTLGTFTSVLKSSTSVEAARTAALITLVLSQLIHVFECKSEEKSLFSVPYFSNPFLLFSVIISAAALFAGICVPLLQTVFSTTLLTLKDFTISAAFSLLVPVAAGIGGILKDKKRKSAMILEA